MESLDLEFTASEFDLTDQEWTWLGRLNDFRLDVLISGVARAHINKYLVEYCEAVKAGMDEINFNELRTAINKVAESLETLRPHIDLLASVNELKIAKRAFAGYFEDFGPRFIFSLSREHFDAYYHLAERMKLVQEHCPDVYKGDQGNRLVHVLVYQVQISLLQFSEGSDLIGRSENGLTIDAKTKKNTKTFLNELCKMATKRTGKEIKGLTTAIRSVRKRFDERPKDVALFQKLGRVKIEGVDDLIDAMRMMLEHEPKIAKIAQKFTKLGP